MVGSVGTCQPAAAARRSQARRRARPAYDAGVHLRPRPGPANSPSAACERRRRHGGESNINLRARMSAVSVTQYLGRSGAFAERGWVRLKAGFAASMLRVAGRGWARRATSPLFDKGMQLRFANGTEHRVSTAPTLGKVETAIIDRIRGKDQIVEGIDVDSGILRYASAITQHRLLSRSEKIAFPEELTRALVLEHLVYDKGYAPKDIELERIVRVSQSRHRIDVTL